MTANPPPAGPLPPDDKLLHLLPDEEQFYIEQTGITDPSQLRAHILAVQKAAYAASHLPLSLDATELKVFLQF